MSIIATTGIFACSGNDQNGTGQEDSRLIEDNSHKTEDEPELALSTSEKKFLEATAVLEEHNATGDGSLLSQSCAT